MAEDAQSADREGVPAEGSQLPPIAGWQPHQMRVHEWLAVAAPALAPVYEAAVRMANDRGFPGRVWFMAHALRDIRNRLPDAIAGPMKHSNTQYKDLAAAVADQWTRDGHNVPGVSAKAEGPTSGGSALIEISPALFDAVEELVVGHEAIVPRMVESAYRLFGALAGAAVPQYVVDSWLSATKRAERFAHLRTKPLTEEEVREFEEIFENCDHLLAAMANRSYESMDELDELLAAANS